MELILHKERLIDDMNKRKGMMCTSPVIGALLLVACGVATPAAPSAINSPLSASPTTEGITTLPTPIPSPNPNSAMESPIESLPNQLGESPSPVPRSMVTVNPALAVTPESTPTPLSGGSTMTPSVSAQNPAVVAAREALAKEARIEPSAITVVSVEEVQWPDGCLGVHLPDVMCLQVIVPGYQVTLEANGQRYVYHTDQTGNQVILAEPRKPQ